MARKHTIKNVEKVLIAIKYFRDKKINPSYKDIEKKTKLSRWRVEYAMKYSYYNGLLDRNSIGEFYFPKQK